MSLFLIAVEDIVVNVYNPHVLHNLLKVNRYDRKQRVIINRISKKDKGNGQRDKQLSTKHNTEKLSNRNPLKKNVVKSGTPFLLH